MHTNCMIMRVGLPASLGYKMNSYHIPTASGIVECAMVIMLLKNILWPLTFAVFLKLQSVQGQGRFYFTPPAASGVTI